MTNIPKLSHITIPVWLKENAMLYKGYGKAINDHSHRDSKTLVSGGPSSTGALAVVRAAKDINSSQIQAMARVH